MNIFLFILLNAFNFNFIQCNVVPAPNVYFAKQISETSIRLKWDFQDENKFYNITRYYINFLFDGYKRSWPGQIKKVAYDVTEVNAIGEETDSAFNCFSNCIGNSNCVFARHTIFETYPYCYYIYSYNETKHPSIIGEFGFVDEYKNEIILEGVPYNIEYYIEVLLYDINSASWSLPGLSPIINMTFELELFLNESKNIKNIVIGWGSKNNEFKNYKISKLFVEIKKLNETIENIQNIMINEYDTFQMEPNYAGKDMTLFNYTDSNESCIKLCYLHPTCVLTLFYLSNNTCYLQNGVNIFDGMFHSDESIVYNMMVNTSMYIIENIEPNTYYKIKLNGLTPYGSEIYSNEIIYYAPDFKPNIEQLYIKDLSVFIKLKLNEPLETLDRPIFYYSLNDTNNYSYDYIFSMDYIDPDQIRLTANDADECYKLCLENFNCTAFTYQRADTACILKRSKTNPIRCAEFSVCVDMPVVTDIYELNNFLVNTKYCIKIQIFSFKFKYYGLTSEPFCFQIPVESNLIVLDKLIENQSTYLFCDVNLNKNNYDSIIWYKDGEIIDYLKLNLTINDDTRFLYFKNLSYKIHNGIYNCVVFLKNGQRIKNINEFHLEILVKPNVSILSNDTLKFNESSYVDIACMFTGNPIPEVEWKALNNDKLLNTRKNDSIISLYFQEINKNDNGKYTCIGKYDNLTVSDTVNIIVQYKPLKPILKTVTFSSKNIFIEWNSIDNGNLDILSMNVNITNCNSEKLIKLKEKSFTSNSLTIDYKISKDCYLQIQIENMLGYSELSDKLKPIYVDTKTPKSTIGISIAIVFFCIILFIIFYFIEKRKLKITEVRTAKSEGLFSFKNHNYD